MRPELIKTLVEKLAKYYGYSITDVDYEFWVLTFEGDVTEEEFKNAARTIIRSDARFMPKAGEVYQAILRTRAAARIEGLPTVTAGICEIRDSLGEYDRAPKYSHPLLDKTVELVGYWQLGHMPSQDVAKAIGQAYGELRKAFLAGEKVVSDQVLIDWKRVRLIGECKTTSAIEGRH